VATEDNNKIQIYLLRILPGVLLLGINTVHSFVLLRKIINKRYHGEQEEAADYKCSTTNTSQKAGKIDNE